MGMRSWFYKRGYPKGLVEEEIGKIKLSGYTRKSKSEKKWVPIVITYRLSLKDIERIINQNLHILYMNEEIKSVFTPTPTISFHSVRKLSSYLVRKKVYPLECEKTKQLFSQGKTLPLRKNRSVSSV